MRHRILVALVVAAASAAVIAQEPQQPREGGYVNTHRPKGPAPAVDGRIRDDAEGRREAIKEQFGGEFTPEFMEQVMSAANEQLAQYGPGGRGGIKVAAGGEWTNIGPTGSNWIQNGVRLTESDTGRIRAFLIHPNNNDIVYVLQSNGGLWKTTNFSHPRPAWRAMSDTVLSTAGGGVGFGKNPETLYLGTGDPLASTYNVGGYIYKSINGGATWSAGMKLGPSTVIPDLKVDTSGASDVVLAGTNGGLYRSTDSGATYTPVLGGLIWSIERTSAGWLVGRTSGGLGQLWLSTNKGETWSQITAPTVTTGAGRITLGVGAPGDADVYAFVHANATATKPHRQKDLYRSRDGGLTWTAIGLGEDVTTLEGTPPAPVTRWVGKVPVNPNEDQPDMDIMNDQATYNHLLLVDPNDAERDTVYIGGQLSSAKTTDGGDTWRLVSNWLAQYGLPYVHADHHAAAFTSVNGVPTMLFGTDGGLFLSDDGARTFSSLKNDGMSSYLIYAMTGNPKHPDDVLIGLQDNGTRLRTGPTGTYNQVFGGDGFGVAWSQANDDVSLASVYYSYIVRAPSNPPATQNKYRVGWNGISEFFNPNYTYFHTSLAAPPASADPTGLTFFHRTRYKLYRTTNGAVSWQTVFETFNPVPPPPPPAPLPAPSPLRLQLRAGLHPIGTSPQNSNHFGVLANGGHVFLTADGGATWMKKIVAQVAPAPPAIIEPGSEVVIVPGWPGFNATLAYASNNTMYIGNEAAVGFLNPGNVVPLRAIKSTDGGNSWSAASGSGSNRLPNVPIAKLLVSPRDPSGNTVYAGTFLGVYETTDGGANWKLFGTGLPVVNVSDLYMPPDGSYLRVATYGRGVWETRF
jgi:photosystem II stability/assembly factor-like uncharacterized protein